MSADNTLENLIGLKPTNGERMPFVKTIFKHTPLSLVVMHDAARKTIVLHAVKDSEPVGELLMGHEDIRMLIDVMLSKTYAKDLKATGFKAFGRNKDLFFFRDDDSQEVFRFPLNRAARLRLVIDLMTLTGGNP